MGIERGVQHTVQFVQCVYCGCPHKWNTYIAQYKYNNSLQNTKICAVHVLWRSAQMEYLWKSAAVVSGGGQGGSGNIGSSLSKVFTRKENRDHIFILLS